MNEETKMTPACAVCGEQHDGAMYIHGRCHLTAPTWAMLCGNRLQIVCSECGLRIVTFQIADPLPADTAACVELNAPLRIPLSSGLASARVQSKLDFLAWLDRTHPDFMKDAGVQFARSEDQEPKC